MPQRAAARPAAADCVQKRRAIAGEELHTNLKVYPLLYSNRNCS
ncbi:MAG: hypothetical protein RM368_38135 [Nostoc sp. DedSLP03]|nr:hypothetical protein [Nostoc sp. DedSLP03]MDZ7970682.1 hypothetical protein [Nostoc sp. DedSLP03]